jgi:hypothetical protein
MKVEMTADHNNIAYRVRCDEHFVHFYQNDDRLLAEVAEFVGRGLQAGDTAIVIATATHRERLSRQVLRAVPHLEASSFYRDQYIALDAEETLSRFMVNGWPDEQRFTEVVGGVVRRAAQAGCGRILAFGEMVALLVEQGKTEAAIRLEELWNELGKHYSFSLFCAYPTRLFRDPAHSSAFARICHTHTRVCNTN